MMPPVPLPDVDRRALPPVIGRVVVSPPPSVRDPPSKVEQID